MFNPKLFQAKLSEKLKAEFIVCLCMYIQISCICSNSTANHLIFGRQLYWIYIEGKSLIMKLGPGLTLVRFLACHSNQDVLFYSLCNSVHLYDFPYTEWMGIVVVVVSLYFLNDMVYFYYENQPYNIHYYSNSFNQATCVRVTCRIEMKIRPICSWY